MKNPNDWNFDFSVEEHHKQVVEAIDSAVADTFVRFGDMILMKCESVPENEIHIFSAGKKYVMRVEKKENK